MDLYKSLLRPLLFNGIRLDPEAATQQLLWACAQLNHAQAGPKHWLKQRLKDTFSCPTPSLRQTLWGLNFANPVGLAAGLDKNGVATRVWPDFGFGFAEVGTVTHLAQPGNPPPRLFRLPLDQAAINRMGFNNQGAKAMAATLEAAQLSDKLAAPLRSQFPIPMAPIGINLGKSKITPLEDAASDYLASFQLLKHLGDYFVINVSSPNTPGLRTLQAQSQLEPIFATLQQANTLQKPLLVKIAPDLAWEEMSEIVTLARAYQLAGIIATNTTIRREGLKTRSIWPTGNSPAEEVGGLSGKPLCQRSTEVIRFIYQQTQGQLPIVGVGGIFTPEDAWEKITAGASLVQVYTGWIYEGPWMVRRILAGLIDRLATAGYPNLAAAVGTANPL
jgi:dihydroorotate dehydrogenase